MSPSIVTTESQKRPHVLIAAIPIFGHYEKLWVIASDLVARGYRVSFLSATCYQERIEKAGAQFIPLQGKADYDFTRRHEILPERDAIPAGPEQVIFDFINLFILPAASQYESVQKFLTEAAASNPEEPVVIVHDVCFLGAKPPVLGAPGLKPAGLISIGIAPVLVSSVDTAPMNMALPPDSSEEGRKRNASLYLIMHQNFRPVQDAWITVLKQLKATDTSDFILDMLYTKSDLFLQLCIPDIEYPRSDAPKNLRYIGALPPGRREKMALPSWWDEIVKHEKKLIVVSQGTASNNPLELILPTLDALKDLDVLVVATLVRYEAIEGYSPPTNARIAKFVPFDQLFEHADVIVSNGGYGTIQQGFSAGVPMVLSGMSEDKPEACARAAWTGAAINLATQTPTVALIREAVQTILEVPDYRSRALELKDKYLKYDSLTEIAASIDELASRTPRTVEVHKI